MKHAFIAFHKSLRRTSHAGFSFPLASPLSPAAMSTSFVPITISTLQRISPNSLASLLLSPDTASKVAVIDVRDSDHLGGHIKSSHWIPLNELDARIPELMRLHRDKDHVVFHCMLSQQRGPSAALKFARAMRDKEEKERKELEKQGKEGEPVRKQSNVYVLEGGFGMWQARYGEDERLTEGYVKDLWE